MLLFFSKAVGNCLKTQYWKPWMCKAISNYPHVVIVLSHLNTLVILYKHWFFTLCYYATYLTFTANFHAQYLPQLWRHSVLRWLCSMIISQQSVINLLYFWKWFVRPKIGKSDGMYKARVANLWHACRSWHAKTFSWHAGDIIFVSDFNF